MSVPLEEAQLPQESPDLYRTTLADYSPAALRAIRDHLELRVSGRSPAQLVKAIEDHLREPSHRAAAVIDLPNELRSAVDLLPHIPPSGWRLEEVRELLRHVGCAAPEKALRTMLGLGFLVVRAPNWRVETIHHFDLALNGWEGEQLLLFAHPALAHQFTTPLFDLAQHRITQDVRNLRESDGLEFLLRVAVLWQRIAENPLRLTQETGLFKRDQERLSLDPVLSSPVFDEIAPVRDMLHLAMLLGKHLGLLVADPDTESLRAHLCSVWQKGIPQIQRRIWHALMSTRNWAETSGDSPASFNGHHISAKRWACLLLLASLEPGTWIPLSELDRELAARDPQRALDSPPQSPRPFQVVVGREIYDLPTLQPRTEVEEWLELFLLGGMYQLGVVYVAEDASSGERVVNLSPLGRWLLGVGPQPTPRPVFEKTLFVQPNHEVVAYRQGLTPELVGQLASFCRWKGLGAALTLELTPDSVYRGLELGRTAEEMINILDRHSQRPVPPAVADSMRTWSGRRERLRLYNRCTVLEFASAEDLEQAVVRGLCGDRLTDRMFMVADERTVPFDQFRLAGVRDYRQPPAICVTATEDGITWEVELARSDMLVERELARFAEPLADGNAERIRYRITPASLAGAARLGLRGTYLREWFLQRAGRELPASVELMLQASSRSAVELARLLVLQTPKPSVADGIVQHPATRQHIVRRIGPTSLAVSPAGFDALKAALQEMGVEIKGSAV